MLYSDVCMSVADCSRRLTFYVNQIYLQNRDKNQVHKKRPDTRINRKRQRPYDNTHNRHTRTANGHFFRWGMAVAYSRYKFLAASLPERLRSGRFNYETAVRRAAVKEAERPPGCRSG
jgi:hypothetical protein